MADMHQRVILSDGIVVTPENPALGSLSNPLSIVDGFSAPAALTWTSATGVNTANTLSVVGYDGVMISVVTAPGINGGVLAFEVFDGAAWIPAQAGKMNGYGGQTTLTLSANLNQGFQINTAGCQQFRTRIATAIAGTGNVVVTHASSSANMPDPLTVGIDTGTVPYNQAQTPAGAGLTGAAAAIAPALAAVAGKTNYVTGFEVTGGGATAASLVTATLTGLAAGTFSYVIAVPAGATLGVAPLVVEFNPPLPASAVNTAITLNLPSLGAGNTAASAVIHGFNQ